jgi:hypothetical protein
MTTSVTSLSAFMKALFITCSTNASAIRAQPRAGGGGPSHIMNHAYSAAARDLTEYQIFICYFISFFIYSSYILSAHSLAPYYINNQ